MSDYLFPETSLTPEAMASRLTGNLPGLIVITAVETLRERMVLGLDVGPNHMAPNGFLHAGTLVTLADTAAGFSTLANLREGQGFTTLELKSNFFATVREGRIQATTTPVHIGRSTQVWDAEVTALANGKRLALFRCTQMVLSS